MKSFSLREFYILIKKILDTRSDIRIRTEKGERITYVKYDEDRGELNVFINNSRWEVFREPSRAEIGQDGGISIFSYMFNDRPIMRQYYMMKEQALRFEEIIRL